MLVRWGVGAWMTREGAVKMVAADRPSAVYRRTDYRCDALARSLSEQWEGLEETEQCLDPAKRRG